MGGSATAKLSAAQTRSLLDDPESGVLAAGLLTEIVQGEGGVIPAPDEWVREIQRLPRPIAFLLFSTKCRQDGDALADAMLSSIQRRFLTC